MACSKLWGGRSHGIEFAPSCPGYRRYGSESAKRIRRDERQISAGPLSKPASLYPAKLCRLNYPSERTAWRGNQAGYHRSGHGFSLLILGFQHWSATDSGLCPARNAIDGVAALRALFVRTDLADPLEDFDLDALLGETGEKAADRVWGPGRRLGDLRSAGAFRTAEHGQHLRALRIPRQAWIMGHLDIADGQPGRRAWRMSGPMSRFRRSPRHRGHATDDADIGGADPP
jgi:hypothetical protein